MVATADNVAFELLKSAVNDSLTRDVGNKLSFQSGDGRRSATLTAALRDIINGKQSVQFLTGAAMRGVDSPGWLATGDENSTRRGVPTPATVYVDPRSPQMHEVFVEVGGVIAVERQHDIPALAHEMAHALDFVEGTTTVMAGGQFAHTWKHGRGPLGGKIQERALAHEHEAVDFENVVRRELGLKRRVFYAVVTPRTRAIVNGASGTSIRSIHPGS